MEGVACFIGQIDSWNYVVQLIHRCESIVIPAGLCGDVGAYFERRPILKSQPWSRRAPRTVADSGIRTATTCASSLSPWKRVRVMVRAASRCAGSRSASAVERVPTPRAPSPRPSPTKYRGRGRNLLPQRPNPRQQRQAARADV